MCILYIHMHNIQLSVHINDYLYIFHQSAVSKYQRRVCPYASIICINIVPSHASSITYKQAM